MILQIKSRQGQIEFVNVDHIVDFHKTEVGHGQVATGIKTTDGYLNTEEKPEDLAARINELKTSPLGNIAKMLEEIEGAIGINCT